MEKQGTIIFSDGGARGNPGPGACAFIIRQNGRTLSRGSKYLGKVTNNFAEYSGVLLALDWLAKNSSYVTGNDPITFFMDSELVVNQINGKYKIKNVVLKKLYQEIEEIIDKNNLRLLFKSIPRSKNKTADLLVNQELDKNSML